MEKKHRRISRQNRSKKNIGGWQTSSRQTRNSSNSNTKTRKLETRKKNKNKKGRSRSDDLLPRFLNKTKNYE